MTVPRGEITTLLGPNGAGKSSLVLALAGLIPARAGTVRIGSTDLGRLDPEQVRAHGVATVPEGHRVLRSLSVSDNLRVAAVRMTREDEAAGRERVLALLPELEPLLDRPAGKLSGGQQQMLAIAQAVIDPPDFLVIDELSLGLAPVVVRRLVPTLSQVAAAGVGVLLIEQFTTVALVRRHDRGRAGPWPDATPGARRRPARRPGPGAQRLSGEPRRLSWTAQDPGGGSDPGAMPRVRRRYSRGLTP